MQKLLGLIFFLIFIIFFNSKVFSDIEVKKIKNENIEIIKFQAPDHNFPNIDDVLAQIHFPKKNNKNLEISQSPISAKNLSKLINLIKNGTISGKIAKTIFEMMMDGDVDPQIIVEKKGLKQESDPSALEALIDKIINDNREKAIEYKQGKEKLFGFFVGQAMKVSGGKANPQLINEILKKKL